MYRGVGKEAVSSRKPGVSSPFRAGVTVHGAGGRLSHVVHALIRRTDLVKRLVKRRAGASAAGRGGSDLFAPADWGRPGRWWRGRAPAEARRAARRPGHCAGAGRAAAGLGGCGSAPVAAGCPHGRIAGQQLQARTGAAAVVPRGEPQPAELAGAVEVGQPQMLPGSHADSAGSDCIACRADRGELGVLVSRHPDQHRGSRAARPASAVIAGLEDLLQ